MLPYSKIGLTKAEYIVPVSTFFEPKERAILRIASTLVPAFFARAPIIAPQVSFAPNGKPTNFISFTCLTSRPPIGIPIPVGSKALDSFFEIAIECVFFGSKVVRLSAPRSINACSKCALAVSRFTLPQAPSKNLLCQMCTTHRRTGFSRIKLVAEQNGSWAYVQPRVECM